MSKDPNKYPKGWSQERVAKVIAHYDKQSDDDGIAEAQAAWENSRMQVMVIPSGLVRQVEALIRQHREGKSPQRRSVKKGGKRVA